MIIDNHNVHWNQFKPKVTTIIEEQNVPCPTCGTLCDSIKTTVIQGKSGGSTAEYTPIPNTNIEE